MYSGSFCLYKVKMHINPLAEWFRPVKTHALCTGLTQLAPTAVPITHALTKVVPWLFSRSMSSVPAQLRGPRRTCGPVSRSGVAREAGGLCRCRTALRAGKPPLAGAAHGSLYCGPGGQISCAGLGKKWEVQGLGKTGVCQGSLICKMKTEAVKSVDLDKL